MNVNFGGYWLAGDPSLGLRVNPPAIIVGKSADRLTQVVDGPGWPGVLIIDRGNQVTTMSFRCERVFDTTQEAESYMMGYEADAHHPWDQATCFITAETPGGTKFHYMHPAQISPPRFSYSGCRVFAEYTVQGAEFTSVLSWAADLWFEPGGNLVPTGEKTPTAGQAWELSGGNLVPAAAITADSQWEHSGGNLRPKA